MAASRVDYLVASWAVLMAELTVGTTVGTTAVWWEERWVVPRAVRTAARWVEHLAENSVVNLVES